MNIIKPSVNGANSESFNIIPRDNSIERLVLRDENTNEKTEFDLTSITHSLSISQKSYYQELTLDFDSEDFKFLDDHYYQLTVYNDDDEIIFKGKLFATSQTATIDKNKKFNNNIGEYITPPNEDNDYIIID